MTDANQIFVRDFSVFRLCYDSKNPYSFYLTMQNICYLYIVIKEKVM